MKVVQGKGNGRKANDEGSEQDNRQPRPIIQIGERRDRTISPPQSTPTQPTPRIITNHQDELASVVPFPDNAPPDIISELTRNIGAYRVDKRGEKEPVEWLTLYKVPASIGLTLNKIQGRLRGLGRGRGGNSTDIIKNPPRKVAGIRTIFNCCIQNGISIVSQHPGVIILRQCRTRFYDADHRGIPEELFVRSYLKTPLQFLTNEDAGGSERYNLPLDIDTKDTVAELAESIGVSQEVIVMLCVYEFLLYQPDVVPRRLIDVWEKEVNVFYRLLELKAKGAEALCRVFVIEREEEDEENE